MKTLQELSQYVVFQNLHLITTLSPYRQKKIIEDYLQSENNKKTYSWIIKEVNKIKHINPLLESVLNEILDNLKKIPKFYTYYQQGWEQDYTENISNYTVIEACSAIEANEKAERLGINTDPEQNLNNKSFPINTHNQYYPFWNIVTEEDGSFNETENVEEPNTDSYFVHYMDGSMYRSRKANPYLRDLLEIYGSINYDFMNLPNITIFNEIL